MDPRRRSAGIVVVACILVACILAGCGSSSTPSDAPTQVPATAAAPLATSEPPPATATSAPTPEPTPTPVPSWNPYVVPDGRSGEVLAVGTDGTVYVATFNAGGGTMRADTRLVALGPDGQPRADWTALELPAGAATHVVLPGPDGSLYVAIGQDYSLDQSSVDDTSLLRLDASGAVAPGWPVTLATPGISRMALVGEDLVVTWSAATDGATVERIGPDGTVPAGWPVQLETRALLTGIGAPGNTAYVDTYTLKTASNGMRTSSAGSVAALGGDGLPIAGWMEPGCPAGQWAELIPLRSGFLEIRQSFGVETGPVSLIWLNADGAPAGPTAKGPAMQLVATVGPDGTPYLAYGSGAWSNTNKVVDATAGSIVAYGADGKALPGWPVKFKGWPQNGLWARPLSIGPDGTIWVLERFDGTKVLVHALGPDGKALAAPVELVGDYFTAGSAGPGGAFYVTDRANGVTTVLAMTADGR